jgi:hypothetical protein
MTDPDFTVAARHRYFSAVCFNKAWEFADEPERSRDDDEQLLHLIHASVSHWMQRPECTSKQKTIGYRQLSRIYAILGRAEEARRHRNDYWNTAVGWPSYWSLTQRAVRQIIRLDLE